MRDDMNIYKLVQTIKKLKASTKAIIENLGESKILPSVREHFVKEVILESSDEDTALPCGQIDDFLNRDEKRALFDDEYVVHNG